MLNIKRYHDPRKQAKRLIFIDPSVMELRTADEYSHIEELHYLAQGHLLPNEYISIDYPCDMVNRDLPFNEYREKCNRFIERSIANNWRYKDNPQYICAIQFEWMNITDFYHRMAELEPIYKGQKKIVALGNLCRIMRPCKYLDLVIDYLCAHAADYYWIHIYGMALACIKAYGPRLQYCGIPFSVDSTKWTRACNSHLHAKYVKTPYRPVIPFTHPQPGVGCTKATRNEFFLTYLETIRKKGIIVEA